jgi:hypothetical protein
MLWRTVTRERERSGHARARIALALCVLWVAGFELLPWSHVALHDELAQHHHDANGAIVFEHAHGHAHSHDAFELESAGHTDANARLAAALGHGQHSLAHHGVAVATPAPVVVAPLPIDRRATFVATIEIVEPISSTPGRAVARGPPLAPS